MALIDRYELRALVAVAVQILLFLGVLTYGLIPPSLGTRLFWPTLAMLPIWGGLVWLTLHRPWDWGGLEPRNPLGRMWGYWEPGVVFGGTFGIARMHGRLLGDAKEYAARLQPSKDDLAGLLFLDAKGEAWANDTLGALILNGPLRGEVAVGGAALVLLIVWFLLPR